MKLSEKYKKKNESLGLKVMTADPLSMEDLLKIADKANLNYEKTPAGNMLAFSMKDFDKVRDTAYELGYYPYVGQNGALIIKTGKKSESYESKLEEIAQMANGFTYSDAWKLDAATSNDKELNLAVRRLISRWNYAVSQLDSGLDDVGTKLNEVRMNKIASELKALADKIPDSKNESSENSVLFDSITKDQFDSYEKVREGGKYNMIMDARDAAEEAGLDRDTYFCIIKNYSELKDKFNKNESKVEENMSIDEIVKQLESVDHTDSKKILDIISKHKSDVLATIYKSALESAYEDIYAAAFEASDAEEVTLNRIVNSGINPQ